MAFRLVQLGNTFSRGLGPNIHGLVKLPSLKLASPKTASLFQNRLVLLSKFEGSSAFSTKVPIELVKELRKRTLAGYTDCKKALEQSENNIDRAIQWLREKGAMKAASKANRVAAEGLVTISINPTKTIGTIAEMNSETDFVARGEKFGDLLKKISELSVNTAQKTQNAVSPFDLESFFNAKTSETQTVKDSITEVIGQLGEKIDLRRIHQVSIGEGKGIVAGYVHQVQDLPHGLMGGTAALVALESETSNKNDLEKFAQQLATHIVGLNPLYLNASDVSKDVMEEYKQEFLRKKEKDPHHVTGEFSPKSVISEICLMEQDYVFGGGLVKDIIEKESQKLGSPIKVVGYKRYACGEGIEKKEEDFAKEVNEILQSSQKS